MMMTTDSPSLPPSPTPSPRGLTHFAYKDGRGRETSYLPFIFPTNIDTAVSFNSLTPSLDPRETSVFFCDAELRRGGCIWGSPRAQERPPPPPLCLPPRQQRRRPRPRLRTRKEGGKAGWERADDADCAKAAQNGDKESHCTGQQMREEYEPNQRSRS